MPHEYGRVAITSEDVIRSTPFLRYSDCMGDSKTHLNAGACVSSAANVLGSGADIEKYI